MTLYLKFLSGKSVLEQKFTDYCNSFTSKPRLITRIWIVKKLNYTIELDMAT